MIYVLIAALTVQTVVIVAGITFSIRSYLITRRAVLEFITPAEPGTPSPLARTIEGASDILARAITARMSTAIMTGSSALSRAAKAVEGDVIEDTVRNASPALDALLTQFPTLKKTLRRNPALVDIGLQAMTRAMAGKEAAKQAPAAPLDLSLGPINR